MSGSSRRSRLWAAAAAVLLFALTASFSLGPTRRIIDGAFDPSSVASPQALVAQRDAAERGIQRSYQRAIEQLETTRRLTVSLSPAQIAAILDKTAGDLRGLRRNALAALGEALGAQGDGTSRYVAEAEARLDALPDTRTEPGVLLAPRLLAIVQRMNELAAQLADDATRQVTVPSAPPSASARPSPSASR